MQNVINAYTLTFVIATIFTLALYLVYIFKRKEGLNLIPVVISIATVFLLYRLISVAGSASYYDVLALDICIAIIATILAIFYISKPYIFIGLTILLLFAFVIFVGSYPGNSTFAGMFAIGTIYGLIYREFVINPKKDKKPVKNKSKEINRDLIQIFLGIVLVAVIYFLPHPGAIDIIFALIILSYACNNLLANLKLSPLYRKAVDLERKNVTYGLGATYLAASTALIMGFTHSTNMLLFGIVALFFADSIATIVGVSLRRAAELPYNRFKTIIGSFAFFVVAAIAGFYLLGYYGILFALILAFVESLNLSLDDNIRTGIVVVILGAVIGL